MMDFDKTPSTDTESNIGSDEDEINRKKLRSSIEDDEEDSNETNLTNIWRKRRKLSSIIQTEITNIEQNNSSNKKVKDEILRSNSIEYEKSPNHNYLQIKPHDHQVPNFVPTFQDDLVMSNRFEKKFNFFFLI